MKLIAALLLAGTALNACAADPLPGYGTASPDVRNTLIGVVRDYYDVLDRAQVTGDVGPLYARHPDLARGEDRRAGVNTESWLVERTRALNVREVTVELESYEPVKVYVKGDDAVVYVHGLFTWVYPNGSTTKGELPVRFDLRKRDVWNIVRTDERVLGETPAPSAR